MNTARARVHRLARLMDSSIRLPGGFRIGIDGLIGLLPVVGAVPVLGDVFDIAFKANLRNARLMDAYLDRSAPY